MIIDCEGCTARPRACGDCVVSFVLEVPARADAGRQAGGGPAFELDEDERRALGTLAALHLVPPLRMAAHG
ncbi:MULTISPECIES: hypothetical protein [Cellulomonas]|uniref:Uncharacterized protein n=1 Tax=Cellulomonas gilvus (strain ATCC 13127 / NRRL B-14078) TaxID=593907 RepID=F8A3P6_CELGA|nr:MULTISPECIES: hypothetical protein [Cellulomonas]AEI11949.1 hypothetical protein Celgi_1430 [Cellulomonas gilvus ATCC 13127]MCR6690271.1 hypothetical protein [Cellulomonas sp.]